MRRASRRRPAQMHGRLLLALSCALMFLGTTLAFSPQAEGPDVASSLEEDQGSAPDAQSPSDVAQAKDYAIADGHFYRQRSSEASPLLGYPVTGAMWDAYQRAGGISALGYPISRSWEEGTAISQAFEHGILRIGTDGDSSVTRLNVLDLLSAAGKDQWLADNYQTPPAVDWASDTGREWPAIASSHLALLEQDPAIRRIFLGTSDWLDRFGLPMAFARSETVVTVRAQRAIVRHFLVDQTKAAAGAVVVTDGAIIAKEAGFVPSAAARPAISPLYGWLQVFGRHIVDGYGRPIRISGINWSGFELRDYAPRGLAVRDYSAIIDDVAALGFNTIRVPFSNELIARNPVPAPDIVAGCPSCQGKPALNLMDMIVDYAGQKGLRIILDNHFSAAADQLGAVLWYTKDYPESVWLQHWQALAERYRDNPAVIGFDLRNEPHGNSTWGSGDPATDWRLAAEKAGQAILAINPHALIIVEGIEQYPKPEGGMDLTWWGGNLQGAREFPVRLPAANLVYSPHEYGPSLYPQRWFNAGTSPDTLLTVWQKNWAYLNLDQDLPLLVGELGTGNADLDVADAKPGSQGQWFQAMLALFARRDNIHWLYWTIDAGDKFALLDASYATVANPAKMNALRALMGSDFAALPGIRPDDPLVDGGRLTARER